jgi:hypothetical protein
MYSQLNGRPPRLAATASAAAAALLSSATWPLSPVLILFSPSFCELFFPQYYPAFKEIEKQFQTEFDYRREAENATAVHDNLRRASGQWSFEHVVVPRIFPGLCTKRVLVMEEIFPAVPLTRALEEQAKAVAKMRGITADQLKDEESAADQQALARGELRQGHGAADVDRYIMLQETKKTAAGWGTWAYDWSIGWMVPRGGSEASAADSVFVPINTAKVRAEECRKIHRDCPRQHFGPPPLRTPSTSEPLHFRPSQPFALLASTGH